MISFSASASHCSGSLRIIGTVLKLRCRGALANRSDNCCKWCGSLGTRLAASPSLAEAWRRLPAFAMHAANPSPIAPSAVRLCSIIVSLPFGIIVVVHVSHLAAAVDRNRTRAGLIRTSWRRHATCTIIGLLIVHSFDGTRRPAIADDEPDAGHSSNSLFMCIQSAVSIKQGASID